MQSLPFYQKSEIIFEPIHQLLIDDYFLKLFRFIFSNFIFLNFCASSGSILIWINFFNIVVVIFIFYIFRNGILTKKSFINFLKCRIIFEFSERLFTRNNTLNFTRIFKLIIIKLFLWRVFLSGSKMFNFFQRNIFYLILAYPTRM